MSSFEKGNPWTSFGGPLTCAPQSMNVGQCLDIAPKGGHLYPEIKHRMLPFKINMTPLSQNFR